MRAYVHVHDCMYRTRSGTYVFVCFVVGELLYVCKVMVRTAMARSGHASSSVVRHSSCFCYHIRTNSIQNSLNSCSEGFCQ